MGPISKNLFFLFTIFFLLSCSNFYSKPRITKITGDGSEQGVGNIDGLVPNDLKDQIHSDRRIKGELIIYGRSLKGVTSAELISSDNQNLKYTKL